MSVNINYNPVTDYAVAKGMTYDTTTRLWYLTIDEISDEFDDNLTYLLKTEKKASAFLREISRQVDMCMQEELINESRPINRYLLEHDEARIDNLKQAQLEQYRYARVSGGNLMGYQSGINPKTGLVIDPDFINKMVVGPTVKKTLNILGLTNQRISYTIPDNGTKHGVDF